jgi:Leucine-rich repeat (LRR) protein
LTDLTDLEPLRNAPLKEVWLTDTPVRDLGPLARAPLVQLDLRRSAINSLDPLRGSPVETLFLDGCLQLEDLAPLMEMPRLATLTVSRHPRPPRILRQHPALQRIGFSPSELSSVEEFFDRERPPRPFPGNGEGHPDPAMD